MPLQLFDIFDRDELAHCIDNGYVNKQVHPTLPLAILNYTHKTQGNRYWTQVTRQCRGLIYNTLSNNIVARGFNKFFNIGEDGGVTLERFFRLRRDGHRIRIYEKLDGSMGILWQFIGTDGVRHVGVATRGSFTSPQAVWATDWLKERIRLSGSISWSYNLTPVVEIIYPENRIVVKYDQAGLVLLGMVVSDGTEATAISVRQWAANNGLPMVRSYAGKGLAGLAQETRPNFEGYVISTDSSQPVRAKIKMAEYCRLHKLITGWNAKSLWEYMKDGKNVDELINDETLPEHFKTWVKLGHTELSSRYKTLEIDAKDAFVGVVNKLFARFPDANATPIPRKTWAWHIGRCGAGLSPILFKMLDNEDYSSIIWDRIKPKGNVPFLQDTEISVGATA